MKTKLMAGASALTLVILAPGVAQAVPSGACGVPATSADPNVVSCISDSTDFANGISYDQSTYGTPANLRIDIYGTAVVNATGTPTAVTISGSANHDALISALGGSKITGTQTGLEATTSGTGNAVIENHGTVNTGGTGAFAGALGTGSATITNASDGTVTVTQPSSGGVIGGVGLGITGTNGSIVNQGTVTVNSAGSGQFFGLGASGLGGGTLTATNSNLVKVTTDGADAVGIGTVPSAGNFVLANNATLTVSSNTGSATGLAVSGNGSTGTSALTNTGALSVTSTSGSATGMSVDQATDATMAATRTSAASTFTVSGADATGFAVTNATGAVSVTGSGQYVGVTGTNSATGVSVSGGTTQTVAFAPATVGGTAYPGDLDVRAGSDASGVVLNGATDAVSVGFTGANLTVTSTGAGAKGIDVTGGSSVDISVIPGSGNGASLTVSAAGGDASGISTSGATGAQSVTLGDLFNVTNTAGSAVGISLEDGTDQTVSLAIGATVTGSDGASGVALAGGTGAVSVTSSGALTVEGGTGDAYGVAIADGSSQQVHLAGALDVTGAGLVYGVYSTDSTGAVAITAADTVNVTSSDGEAVGAFVYDGTDVAVSFAKGLNVQGSTVAAGAVAVGSGALSIASMQDVSVNAGDGIAFGTFMAGGTSQVATVGGNLNVAGGVGGFGSSQSGATGAVSLAIAGDFTGANLFEGLVQQGGTTQSIDLGGNFSLTSTSGDIQGADLTDSTESASLTVGGTFDVSAAAGSAIGVNLSGNDGSVSLAQGMAVSAAGASAFGLTASLDGDANVTLGGALSVTNDASSLGGTATGLSIGSLGAQTVSLAGPVTVSADGTASGIGLYGDSGAISLTTAGLVSVQSASGAAQGVTVDGGSDQTVTLTGGLDVSAAGDVGGVELADGTGTATLHLPTSLSVTSTDGAATGILAHAGNSLVVDGGGAITATGATGAYGVQTADFTGTQNLVLGDVSATTQTGEVFGVDLAGSGAIALADSGSVVVASGSGTGAGVSLVGTGADGALTASLADVQASGDGVQGVILSQTGNGASGAITATLASVSTTGADASGVTVRGADAGTVSLTLGGSVTSALLRAAAVDHSGGVSTQGDNANGVNFIVGDGAGSLTNLGSVTTGGANSDGIAATATGTGSISINSWNVATSGAGSNGISVQTGSGAQTLTVQTVAVTGAGARGIVATSGSGAITLASTGVSAASGDAVSLNSATGDVSATLVGGGNTVSKTGAGLAITTGGSAAVTQGAAATLHGATYGLVSDAAGGQTVVLSGTVGADSNHAVALSGGAATLTNNGTINGYMTFDTASTTLTNAGTWNAQGGNSTFAGNATVINSGTLNINAAATAAATMKLTGVTTFRNSGTISLVNGHTGDVLDLGNAAFVGSGNSRVVLEANLGASAVGSNPAQSADQLNVGAASGTTTIVITDLSGSTAAKFNFDGIRLVNAASATAGAFVLDGGAVNKGFVDYQLVTDATGNVDLVGVPSTQAFELVRTGAEVRHYWRRSGDAWSDQMRGIAPKDGTSLWGQVLGGSETNRSRPLYSETVLGTAKTFAPNLDVRDTWWGGQFGFDWGHGSDQSGDWGVGMTAGYVSQEGKVKSTGDQIKLNGGNVGLYARYRSAGGFFAHGLAKLDRYSLKYDMDNGASAPKTNGTSYGVEIEAGYHIRTGMLFLEPSASASWTNADLDGFAATQGGVGAKFNHVQSFYGRAGLRAGVETHSGNWAIQPYVGANWEGEMNGRPGATLSSGGEDLYFRDDAEGGRARWEVGVQGASDGLSAFAKVEGVTGSGSSGVAGRAGVAFRF
ncbi:outer membrane autotransporter protein [Novosphingobium sp. PhB165]|uniref:autotransporter outer membrane beta-barrel domain-containing protein n=1 Tax=Novosphingobium sp. PhB165 TaxID=2485105 RepID=UPI001049C03B|nr:autotransporter outer membrane beta-barrel domain-containing protein [Novosphingobium sp. PhB165]TCM16100.1 outer membrane autotransporter protein [Novosphingobium sp. PhB165]